MLQVATVTVICQEVNQPDELIPVLVLCPSQDEKQLLDRADLSAYCFHCLEYSVLQTTPPRIKGKVDLVAFCQDAIAYAKEHQILAVYYSFDIANIVAAVVCESLNLFGPRIESILQCFHKLYAREIDRTPPGYGVVQLGNEGEVVIDGRIKNALKFPVFFKPVCSSYGMFCARVDRPEQLQQVCNNNSFFSAEFCIQDRGTPILIEINARRSATLSFLYQQSLNFNLHKAALTLALGNCPEIPKRTLGEQTLPASCRLYMSTRKTGLASTMFDFSLAQQTLGCSQLITFNCEPWEQVKGAYYHPTPLAELNLVGANRAALQFYGEHLRNALLLERRYPAYKIAMVQDCVLQGGEGLCYDPKSHQLFCLDYGEPQLIQLCLKTRKMQRIPLPGSCYGMAVSGMGTVVLSGELGLVELNLNTQELVPIIQDYQGKQLVCNDAIVDPTGQIWFNTIDEDATAIRGTGALLMCDRQGQVREVFAGLGYANGMGLSPDGRSLYLVDSLERAVHVFAIDTDKHEHHKFIVADENEGVPDGLAVDAAGRLWLTFWFGGKIVCIDPRSQERVREVFIPVMNISSVSVVDSKGDHSADAPCKLFACSSAVPWPGGKVLAPWYAGDLPVPRQGYLFVIDIVP
ncbi:MAG: SMP-30/gluconolactonase/LRE family protein [Hormoscilla sp. GM7CHS1pb]|nr:SMP-30/gluconolactonase/LRE family protein [Hormoscilla sp. GM7CHS1pb]